MTAARADQKRVLGIVGSPRRGGNTETLVDEVLRGAEEAGAQVAKIILSELNIAPCRACDGCADTGECVQRDDMSALLARMQASQVWVLGTPVYWWGPTAQFKTFVDRWYSAQRTVDFREQRAVLAIPMEDGNVSGARYVVGMMAEALDYLGVELFATVLAPGVLDPGAVRGHEDVLAMARRAGREAVTSPPVSEEVGAGEDVAPPAQPAGPNGATMSIDDLFSISGPRMVVAGAPIPLPRQHEVLVGRVKPGVSPQPDVDLVVHGGDLAGVSRQHARLVRGLEGWFVEDLRSTNGTFVNGVEALPGQRVRLRSGDYVRFGHLTLLFYEE